MGYFTQFYIKCRVNSSYYTPTFTVNNVWAGHCVTSNFFFLQFLLMSLIYNHISLGWVQILCWRCWSLRVYSPLRHWHLKTQANNQRAGKKEQMIAHMLIRAMRGVAWRRRAALFKVTWTGRWSLTSSTWWTKEAEFAVKPKYEQPLGHWHSDVTDPALGESELSVDVVDLGRVRSDGLQEGFPMDHDPDKQREKNKRNESI